jgi:caffeoyl-CoA O-methyltransferase
VTAPLVAEAVERYVRGQASPPPALLDELERETRERTAAPEMLSGPVEGRLLQLLVRLLGARRVIEIGTFTGYATLMMAEALPADGQILTCEVSPEHAAIAERYFARSPHGRKVRLALAPALETLAALPDGSVDLVFVDADKERYPAYYEESLRLLRRDGLMAIDNALWGGEVLDPTDADGRAIAQLNERVRTDERVEKVLLTVRDGVYLVRKR